MTPWTIDTLARFFRVLDDADQHDGFWWRANEKQYEPFKILINCNDLFYWACADCEEVTPDTLSVFEQSIRDVYALHDRWGKWLTATRDDMSKRDDPTAPPYIDTSLGLLLYCARVRKLRPQGAYYGTFPPEVAALFDAVGPERESAGGAFGNTPRREWRRGEDDPEKGTPENATPWRCPSCRPCTTSASSTEKP